MLSSEIYLMKCILNIIFIKGSKFDSRTLGPDNSGYLQIPLDTSWYLWVFTQFYYSVSSCTYSHFKIWTHFFLVFGPFQKLNFYFSSKLISCLIIGIILRQKLIFLWHFGHQFCFCMSLNLKNSLHKVICMAQKWKNIKLRGFAHLLSVSKNCLGLQTLKSR